MENKTALTGSKSASAQEDSYISYEDFKESFAKHIALAKKDMVSNAKKSRIPVNLNNRMEYINDHCEDKAIRRVITETVANELSNYDDELKLKVRAIIEQPIYKEVMEHLNRLAKESGHPQTAGKEALINKYMSSSVLSFAISLKFKELFAKKCAQPNSALYKHNRTSGKTGVIIDKVGMAFSSKPHGNNETVESNMYYFADDAKRFAEVLRTKQEKFLRTIIGEDTSLDSIYTLASTRGADITNYLEYDRGTSMKKYDSFSNFFNFYCSVPATCSILKKMQEERNPQA